MKIELDGKEFNLIKKAIHGAHKLHTYMANEKVTEKINGDYKYIINHLNEQLEKTAEHIKEAYDLLIH